MTEVTNKKMFHLICHVKPDEPYQINQIWQSIVEQNLSYKQVALFVDKQVAIFLDKQKEISQVEKPAANKPESCQL